MCANKTACFYYPTTVIVVDDNEAFLETLPANLSNTANYKLFASPQDVMTFLDQQKDTLLTNDNFLGMTDDLVTGETLQVNIPKIRARLHDKKRYNTPSVIIVDHDMPGISGIELCQRLADYPIKKIMLTGAADHKLAVAAFNDNIINKFIAKDETNVFEAIDKAIQSLQQEYFAELSELIIKNIMPTTGSLLENKAFLSFFTKLCEDRHITEFYLTDPIGSFLLIDNHGAPIWLVTQTEQQIKNYYQTAEDHNAPNEIIQALANKEKLLCLFTEADFTQPVSAWADYLYPAHKITDVPHGYYALVSEDSLHKRGS